MDAWLPAESQVFESNKIVSGRVLEIRGEDVVIDIGYKSEGIIKLDEWRDEAGDIVNPPKPGDTIEVLLETVEDEDGTIGLSYRKAKRQKEWEAILAKHKEGDVVTGGSPRRSRAACWSTSGSTCSCRPARWTSAGRRTSASTSARTSSA